METLVEEIQLPGRYTYRLEGGSCPPGLYDYKLKIDGVEIVRRMSRL